MSVYHGPNLWRERDDISDAPSAEVLHRRFEKAKCACSLCPTLVFNVNLQLPTNATVAAGAASHRLPRASAPPSAFGRVEDIHVWQSRRHKDDRGRNSAVLYMGGGAGDSTARQFRWM
jgi:hypothetical protein